MSNLSYCVWFRNNRITAEGAVYLSKGLSVNTSLQILKVSHRFLTFAIINKQFVVLHKQLRPQVSDFCGKDWAGVLKQCRIV